MRKMGCVALVEAVFGAAGRVDREAGVLRQVKILGRESRNGREYSSQALQEAARQYAGLRVNLNHPDRKTPGVERPIQDQFGWLEGISIEADGVYGDLHFLKSHPYTEAILELAERNPGQFGLSHNADGVFVRRGGKTVVESVQRVRSVDVVQRPATTDGLFESEKEPMSKRKTINEVLEHHQQHRLSRRLKSFLEMDGMPDVGETETEVPADAEGEETGLSPEDQIWQAFRAAIVAILDDSTLSVAETSAKIAAVLAKYGEPTGDGEEPAEDGEEPVTEGVVETLRRELARVKRERKAEKILESRDIEATDVRVRAVMAVMAAGDPAVNELCASFPARRGAGRAGGTRPRMSPPASSLLESAGDAAALKSQRAFISALRSGV